MSHTYRFVKHLQTKGFVYSKLPGLMRKLEQTVRQVDMSQRWGLIAENEPLNARVVEYHTMSKKGALPDVHHYDLDSLITIDVMLASPGEDFEGGDLQTLEPGSADTSAQTFAKPTFLKGMYFCALVGWWFGWLVWLVCGFVGWFGWFVGWMDGWLFVCLSWLTQCGCLCGCCAMGDGVARSCWLPSEFLC
jgi:hypothetical protein